MADAQNEYFRLLSQGINVFEALASVYGGQIFVGGMVRVFPVDGPRSLRIWNEPNGWRKDWPNLSSDLVYFAEDPFGNQFGLTSRIPNVILWNHEDGSVLDTLAEPLEFFELLKSNGLRWIDFYSVESAEVFDQMRSRLSLDQHIHWTTPLILGGAVTLNNASVLDRFTHLRGHGALWTKLKDVPPGTEVVL